MSDSAESAVLSRLTKSEIVFHGLAAGLAFYTLTPFLWPGEGGDPYAAGLALLVMGLSVVILTRRFRPQVRGLRILEIGLSTIVSALGAVVTLVFMASGATYKGNSPDAGGMAVMVGFLLYYPMVGLLVLPFLLNASRLSSLLRWRIFWLCVGLAVLPVIVLFGTRLIGAN